MTRRLAREEGLLVGISAGANVAAALARGRASGRGGHRALRWRRAVPVRAVLGGCVSAPLTLGPGVARGHPGAWARDVSARVLRGVAGAGRGGPAGLAAAQHHRGGPEAAIPGAAAGLSRRRSRARRKRGWHSSASIIPTPITPPVPRNTIWITPGRSSRTSSSRLRRAAPGTSRRGGWPTIGRRLPRSPWTDLMECLH